MNVHILSLISKTKHIQIKQKLIFNNKLNLFIFNYIIF